MTARMRATLAAGAGLAVAVGVPLALIGMVGNPLPAGIPGGEEVGAALTRGQVADTTLLKGLAIVCWVAWFELTLALVVEAGDALWGRRLRHPPLPRTMRTLAAALVGTAVGGLAANAGTGAAEAPRPALADALARVPRPAPAHDAAAHTMADDETFELQFEPDPDPSRERAPRRNDERGADPPDLDGPLHVVAHRETLWSIAQDRLGDALRWTELWELNRDQPQNDGHRLERADQALRSGWRLRLPPDARSYESETGNEVHPSDLPPLPVLPGQRDGTEPDPHEAGRDGADDPLPRDAVEAARDAEARAARLDDEVETLLDRLGVIDDESDGAPFRPGSLAEGLSGAGLFAGGMAWSVDSARRRRERSRLPGAPVLPLGTDLDGTDVDARSVELSIRAAADAGTLHFVDLVLRAFAGGLRAVGREAPRLVGVNVEHRDVSLLFSEPDPHAVPGFRTEDGGFSWVASPEAADTLTASAGAISNPFPALVTAGHSERSQVLLDLVSIGSLSVRGSALHVQEAVYAMAVELVTGPWSSRVMVVLVGFGAELADLPNVEEAATLADAVARVRSGPPDGRATVALCAGAQTDGSAAAAFDAAGGESPCGLVIAGASGARWELEVSERATVLRPVGVALQRHRVPQATRRALAHLLTPAADVSPGKSAEDSSSGAPALGRGAPTAPGLSLGRVILDSEQGDEPTVEVRVLGPVEVVGAPSPFRRRKALELVAYLATHRRGVDPDTLAEALWPDRLVSPATLHTTASTARRCLGHTDDGLPLLPPVGGEGVYRLPPEVGLDVDRLRRSVEQVRDAPGSEGIAELRLALELVRGRPFTAVRHEYLWAHAEALVSALAAEAADAAHMMATLCLEAGDPSNAWWATGRGLLASPGNEQLYRDRMLAAERSGNRTGVHEVMADLCRAVEIDEDEWDEVLHPATVELYQALTRGRPARTLVGGV